jgi:hypothetical protein
VAAFRAALEEYIREPASRWPDVIQQNLAASTTAVRKTFGSFASSTIWGGVRCFRFCCVAYRYARSDSRQKSEPPGGPAARRIYVPGFQSMQVN